MTQVFIVFFGPEGHAQLGLRILGQAIEAGQLRFIMALRESAAEAPSGALCGMSFNVEGEEIAYVPDKLGKYCLFVSAESLGARGTQALITLGMGLSAGAIRSKFVIGSDPRTSAYPDPALRGTGMVQMSCTITIRKGRPTIAPPNTA